MSRVLVATTNAGKVAEFLPLLAGLSLTPVGLDQFPELVPAVEDGETLKDNAVLKARAAAAQSGLPALADDSGLEVAALDGAPGLRSARFAGEDADAAANNALLLERLAEQQDRSAALVCWLCLVRPGRSDLIVSGRCNGSILTAPRGQGGFGYDPLFVPDAPSGRGRSFAELSLAEKAAISHRGLALAALSDALTLEPAP